MIDLRSDTVTKPTPAMREAMARAEVGDDVFGDDPTLNHLQALAAEIMGKQAALFVPSGTMGNLAALLAHCGRGQEALLGDESHIYHYEAGGASALGGIVYHTLPTTAAGEIAVDDLRAAVRPSYDAHAAQAGVICLENTHNRCGGVVLSLDYLDQVRALAAELELPLHLDGARMFNAAVALGIDVRQIAERFDSVQFCLSKGLGAPVGSVVAGSEQFIRRVHRMRKMLGGGMRQAGVLAAAGLIALTEMPKRLHEDHAHARMLAEQLAHHPALTLDLAAVQTNIIVFAVSMPVALFVETLRERGVLVVPFKGQVRAVTHNDVSAEDCRQAAQIMCDVLDTMT